jgi:hypothetical protein
MGQRKFTPLRRVSQEFLQQHPNPYIEVFIDLAKSPNAVTTPTLSLWQEYQRELSAAFDRMALLQASPAEALGYVQNRMQQKLDRLQQRQGGPGTP